MRVTLKQLEYIYWVLKLENVSRAAKECFVSQPAITQVLSDFEKDNNIRLFERKGHRINITQTGRDLQKEIESLFSSVEKFENKLDQISQKNRGKVKVGIPPIILSVYFYDLISHFNRDYPFIELEIIELGANELKNKLIENEIDLALLIEPFEHKDCLKYPLTESHFSVVLNKRHPLAQRDSLTLEDISKESLLLLNEEFQLYYIIKDSFHEKNLFPSIIFKTKQPDLLLNMVIHNEKSLTILPSPVLRLYDLGQIKAIPIELKTNWRINLVQRKDINKTSSNKQFIDFVKDWFEKRTQETRRKVVKIK